MLDASQFFRKFWFYVLTPLSELGPEFLHIKQIHNSVADASSQLDQVPPELEKAIDKTLMLFDDRHMSFIFYLQQTWV